MISKEWGRLGGISSEVVILATGAQVTVTGISILRIEGGKIVEEWGEMDNMGLMAQPGVEMG